MASILIPPPATIDPTPAQRAANELRKILHGTAQNLLQAHQNAYQLIWGNSQATPAEVLAALDTDAVEVFTRGSDLVDFLRGVHTQRPIAELSADEFAVPVPIHTHTDGRITLV